MGRSGCLMQYRKTYASNSGSPGPAMALPPFPPLGAASPNTDLNSGLTWTEFASWCFRPFSSTLSNGLGTHPGRSPDRRPVAQSTRMSEMAFRGGLNIEVESFRTSLIVVRRLNATVPLGVLRILDDGIWLGLSPRFGPFKGSAVSCARADVRQVFRSRGMFTWGVGLEMSDGTTNLFWTVRRGAILKVLEARGYSVGADRRPGVWYLQGVTFKWSHRRGRGS